MQAAVSTINAMHRVQSTQGIQASQKERALVLEPEKCLKEGEKLDQLLAADASSPECFANPQALDAIRMRQVAKTYFGKIIYLEYMIRIFEAFISAIN